MHVGFLNADSLKHDTYAKARALRFWLLAF